MKSYSDGAARGNPGPAAIGVLITDDKGLLLASYKGRIRDSTNNQAEYQAVIKALRLAQIEGAEKLVHHSDSELVVKQLQGEYKVKDPDLKKLYLKVKELEKRLKSVEYKHLRREHPKIRVVDGLANRSLDQEE